MNENADKTPQTVSSGYTQFKLNIFHPLGALGPKILLPKICVGCATSLTDSSIASKELIHRRPQSRSISFDIFLCKSCAKGKRRPSDFFCAYPDQYDLVVQIANPTVAAAWKAFLIGQSLSEAEIDEHVKQIESGSYGPEYKASERTVSSKPHITIVSEERFTPETPNWQPPANRTCFIATATMGDANHPSVRLLREFRDGYLLTCSTGRCVVNCYYHIGPVLAQAIVRSRILRRISYHFFVRPAVYLAGKLSET
jgi:hypothetical protein